jgi:ABC-type polysaccharide/polyol phosphate transport system ATPase subunit
MFSDIAMRVENLEKTYHVYSSPASRLKQMVSRGKRKYYNEFTALKPLSFELHKGEVIGIVGRNGAGKSTLLQLICGTLTPTGGTLNVNGRIAALLELGAGFNPEFSGRENVFLSASVMGIERADVNRLLDDIIDFSGIRDFIDQPVKTYSSGMYVRLAFSVATSVSPDILVIDEALSVGDGDFSRRSFDRIMKMRDAGTTILFCSHSLYQLETLCSRSLWIEQGQLMLDGPSEKVVTRYQSFLDELNVDKAEPVVGPEQKQEAIVKTPSSTRIISAQVSVDGTLGKDLEFKSAQCDLLIEIEYSSPLNQPAPGVAITITAASGVLITSSGTWNEGIFPQVNKNGWGKVSIEYPNIPLLKGSYTVGALLFCERGLMIHDEAEPIATLEIQAIDSERGMVALPHKWSTLAGVEDKSHTLVGS